MAEPLTYNQVLGTLNTTFSHLPDYRTGRNRQYTVRDAALSAFSVFYTQSPSFLAYQRTMREKQGHSNAGSLFEVQDIPSDAQIRNLLDPLAPAELRAPFWDLLGRLEHSGVLAAQGYSVSGLGEPRWLCALDGTQYFHSTEIHCPNCTVAMRDGVAHYAHTVLLPALVRPGRAEVLVLEPEFRLGVPQDGAEKQDCERNAARRWIERNAEALAGHHTTILADDLHSNQPLCELLLSQHLDFILVCKPDSHPTLYAEVERLARVPEATRLVEDRIWTGKVHERWTYRYAQRVPLTALSQPCWVNWCDLTITCEETGRVLFHNAWVTNLNLTERTLRPVAAAGRARWKIENENNNVLKNQGYHLEHNFGHGKQSLSTVLVTLMLLAFLTHTIMQLCDSAYQQLRLRLATRKTFFDDLRALTRYLFFASWDDLLEFMLTHLGPAPD